MDSSIFFFPFISFSVGTFFSLFEHLVTSNSQMKPSTLFVPFLTFTAGTFISQIENLIAPHKASEKQIKDYLYYFPVLPGAFLFFYFSVYNEVFYLTSTVLVLVIYLSMPRIFNMYCKKELGLSGEKLEELAIDFTKNCKKEHITLIGGDFDFLGETPEKMNQNSQFKDLKQKKSDQIHIICKNPNSIENKICYGKMIKEFSNVKISIYDKNLDPKIRGKMYESKFGPNGILFFYRNAHNGNYIQINTEKDTHLRKHYLNIWEIIEETIIPTTDYQRYQWVQCYEQYKKDKKGKKGKNGHPNH